ncbi:MAG TPA: diguanylate cyclase response regulator [Syntrophus sp. (in: bacteria)]|nr:diguanylate cyclase response regulator [Syntrophus sp. (in: bacteria)]
MIQRNDGTVMNTVAILSQDPIVFTMVERILKQDHQLIVFRTMPAALDYIYTTIPELMILDIRSTKSSCINLLNQLKEDPIFSQLPVLAIFDDPGQLELLKTIHVEDYIFRTMLEREIITRVNLCICRAKRIVELNPLTRLPGNNAINRQIQERLDRKESFALAYADLDYFKPYNDKYGFSRGDEVIKFTGRLILNLVNEKQSKDNFVGHIGGDDYVFIMAPSLIVETSAHIIRAFDQIIPTFYDEGDRQKGVIFSKDRQGKECTFPIIGISIGITGSHLRAFCHYGEMTGVASAMKSLSKQDEGSIYRIDQRQKNEVTPTKNIRNNG